MSATELTLAQQDLVSNNFALVRKIAGREAKQLPSWVTMDDIMSAGLLGLCQAALRFNPELHASFEIWAIFRIRGAIKDEFRGPRYPRKYQEMPQNWITGAARQETDQEIRHRQQMGICKISGGEAARANMSLLRGSNLGSGEIPDCLIDRRSALDDLIEAEQSVIVSIQASEACRPLNSVEKRVLAEHLDGKSLKQIGKKLRLGAERKPKGPVATHYILKSAKGKARKQLVELFPEQFKPAA